MTRELPELPPERPMPSGNFEARRAHLEREMERPPVRRGRSAILMSVLGLALTGGGAYAAGVFDKPLAAPDRVNCHEHTDRASRHLTAVLDPGPDRRSPLALCAPLYERGYLAGAGPRPALQACFDEGIVRVFPGGSQACARLKLSTIQDDEYRRERNHIAEAFDVAELSLAKARGAVVTEEANGTTRVDYGATRCIAWEQAQRMVASELAAAGLEDFKVEVDPRLRPGSCATEVGVPDRFDGRTIELEGAGTDTHPAWTLSQAEAMAQRRAAHKERVCAEPLGRRNGGRLEDVAGALECHARRRGGDLRVTNCFNRDELRAFTRRVLDHVGLPSWGVQIVTAEDTDRGGFLGAPVIDQRLREVRLYLYDLCKAGGK